MPTFCYLYCLADKAKDYNPPTASEVPAEGRRVVGGLAFRSLRERAPKFSSKGINKKKVYTLPYKDITAVVTEVDSQEFDPKKVKTKLEDSAWTEEKVRNHESVIREAMEGGSVIPLKFLTLYKSKVKIENLLKKQYRQFRNLLDKLKGKTEWGLKVYVVDKENLVEAIKKEDEEIIKMKVELSEKPEGVKYFLEKKMQERISEKISAQLDKYLKDIFEIFLPFSTEKPVINKLFPVGLADKGKEMILNVSYLVPDEKTGEFQRTVRKIDEFYYPKGLWLEFSGPWPPYNFVNHGNKDKETN